MTLDARESASIQRLLQRLPEFRPTFERLVAEEDGELGSFMAINELGRWALPSSDETLLRRVFGAVDEIYTDQSLPDGNELAIEFFESVCEAGQARFGHLIGRASRRWFDRYGW